MSPHTKVEESLARISGRRSQRGAPSVFFAGFGDSSLNFELGVWTIQMTYNPRRFRSDLNFAIEKKFRENQIEIPPFWSSDKGIGTEELESLHKSQNENRLVAFYCPTRFRCHRWSQFDEFPCPHSFV